MRIDIKHTQQQVKQRLDWKMLRPDDFRSDKGLEA